MVAAGIGLVLGLVMLFLGMAIIEQDKKDKKKVKAERGKKVIESEGQADLVDALVDSETPITYVDIRRVKLGAFLVAQGVLMAVVGIAFFVINAYLVKIPWYVAVPVIVVLFVVSLVTDAYMMGAPREGSIEEDGASNADNTDDEVRAEQGDQQPPEGDEDSEV